MSPWRGELEGGDLVLFLDSVLGDSHHVIFRIVLPSDDKLKLSHISLPNRICTYDEFFPGSTGRPGKYTMPDSAHMLMICSHMQT